MNLRPRWQFCSITHEPCVTPVLMSLRAAGSCPWPSEIERTAFLALRASSLMSAVGSEPDESTAMIGQRQWASSSTALRSSGRESMKRCPIALAMYSCAARSIRSSRKERTSSSRSKSPSAASLVSLPSGGWFASGASRSYHCRQSAERIETDAGSIWKAAGTAAASARQLSHAASGSQSCGFSCTDLMSSAPPAVSSACTAGAESSLATCWIFIVSISDHVCLCRSKKPRCM